VFAPFVDFTGMSQSAMPSDIVPGLLIPDSGLQRFGVLVLAFGLLGIAAAIHPRLDGGQRLRPAAGSLALVAIGLMGIVLTAQQRARAAEQIETWRSAHDARADEPIADIVSIGGSVDIQPGRAPDPGLTLELRPPP